MSAPRLDPFRQARICECSAHGFVGLTRELVTFFSPGDLPLVEGMAWQANVRGSVVYAGHSYKNKVTGRYSTLQMHRHLLGGISPHSDHIDGDGLNNQRDNLRGCTHAENLRNRRRQRTGKAGLKGVTVTPSGYIAQIGFDGRMRYLGTFHDPIKAALAYDAAALRLHGAFARTNAMLGLLSCLEAAGTLRRTLGLSTAVAAE